MVSLGFFGPSRDVAEVLSKPGDPFQFVVKEHLPASVPAVDHVADPDGSPMVRIGLQFKGPGMPKAQDAFRSEEEHWFATEQQVLSGRSQSAARLSWRFLMSIAPSWSTTSSSRRRVREQKGSPGSAIATASGKDARLRLGRSTDQQGKSVGLPESELTVTLSEATEFPTSGTGRLDQILGDDSIPIAVFKIQSGKDEPITHMALANLPMVPNVIPPADGPAKTPPRPLASIHYMVAPTLDPKTNGRFGQIEVLAGPNQVLYYRVFGRGKETKGELRAAGPLEQEKPFVAFGGNANMPMTITFRGRPVFAGGDRKADL